MWKSNTFYLNLDTKIDRWSFFLLRLCFFSINLATGLAWNSVTMSWLLFLIATWIWRTGYRNWRLGMLDGHLLLLLNSCTLTYKSSQSVFYRHYFGWYSSELAELVPGPYSFVIFLYFLTSTVSFNPKPNILKFIRPKPNNIIIVIILKELDY